MSGTETKILPPVPETLAYAGALIRAGELVAFPTETVYGLGGNALDPLAAKRIYSAKGRPSDNPLIVHVSDVSEIRTVAKNIPKTAKVLADAFLPGPLTMVLEKMECIPKETTGGLESVAVRVPANGVARAFLRACCVPVAAPSANLSGSPSPTRAAHVMHDLEGRTPLILGEGDEKVMGLESTIVDLTSDVPTLLRPGFITLEELQETLGRVELDPALALEAPIERRLKPRAPGMKYRHYAPKAELTLIEGDPARVHEAIVAGVLRGKEEGKRVGVLASTREEAKETGADVAIALGERPEEIAANLYDALRSLDEEGAEVAFATAYGEHGMYRAIMNRLIKAAGYRIVKV